MRDYHKYEVWKKAHRLGLSVYSETKDFPKEETFGIKSQLRRASLSIPTNIVEGAARNSEKEFSHFLNISAASCSEVEYLLQFSADVGYLDSVDSQNLQDETIEVRKMLHSLRLRLNQPEAHS